MPFEITNNDDTDDTKDQPRETMLKISGKEKYRYPNYSPLSRAMQHSRKDAPVDWLHNLLVA
ncbi:MAG: hypothetical protein HY313_10380 [Acidobacteria bacterium]|nr:hypothetical protein [Acidobacteriota bacterium]